MTEVTKTVAERMSEEIANTTKYLACQAIERAILIPKIEQIWNGLRAIGRTEEEFGLESEYIFDLPNFNQVTEFIEFLELCGFPLESIKVCDEPESKSKRVRIALSKELSYNVVFYAAYSAPCELIEVSRVPQPDRVVYRMECRDEQPAE